VTGPFQVDHILSLHQDPGKPDSSGVFSSPKKKAARKIFNVACRTLTVEELSRSRSDEIATRNTTPNSERTKSEQRENAGELRA